MAKKTGPNLGKGLYEKWVGPKPIGLGNCPPGPTHSYAYVENVEIKMFNRVLFTRIVQFSFRSFVDSVCSALFMCLFALQCRYYLRSGACNIASDQTHLFDVMLL